MKLVVLVPLLPKLLEYNSPLFNVYSPKLRCTMYGTICKNVHVLKFMYAYTWHLCKTLAARGSRTFLPGHFPPRKMQITLLKSKLDWLNNIYEVEAGLMKQFFASYKLDW